MNSEILVSVIIPTYNYEKYIADAIECVLDQTYSNFECLIIDDGSLDDTANIVSKYCTQDSRIIYHHQTNFGVSSARNTGLRLSKGKFIQFLDADDLVQNNKLHLHTEILNAHPEVDIVYGGARYFYSHNPQALRHSMSDPDLPWMPCVSGSGTDILQRFIKSCIFPINAPLIRRDVVNDIGLFDNNVPGVEDWDFWIRCAAAGKAFRYVDLPQTKALIRIHYESASWNSIRIAESIINLRKKIAKGDYEECVKIMNADLLAYHYGYTATDCYKSENYRLGMKYFVNAAKQSATLKQSIKWIYALFAGLIVRKDSLDHLSSTPIKETPSLIFKNDKISH